MPTKDIQPTAIHGFLLQTHKRLNSIISQYSLKSIAEVKPQLIKLFKYMIKIRRVSASGQHFSEAILSMIYKCFQIIKIFVSSTEFQKFGHRLQKLHFIVQRYENDIQIKETIHAQNQTHQIINLNEKCSLLKHFKPISSDEFSFLSHNRISKFFEQVSSQQLLLKDSQCVCCSKIFIKDLQIQNQNPYFSCVVGLSEKQGFDTATLEKSISSVCNEGGGVIVVGSLKVDQMLKVSGIKVNELSQIDEKKIYFEKIISQVQPQTNFLVQTVFVEARYSQPCKNNQNSTRVCFRIVIFPTQMNRIHYFSKENLGYRQNHDVYQLKNSESERIGSGSNEKKVENIYNLIHERYSTKKGQSSHNSINCYLPHTKLIRLVNEESKEDNKQESEVEQELIIYEDTPKFKYTFASLLIVSNRKQERCAKQFSQSLTKKKILNNISRPFDNSFPKGMRTVFLISHEISHSQLRAQFVKYEEQNNLKSMAMVMMPVFKNLHISVAKLCQSIEEQMPSKFKQRFGHSYNVNYIELQENGGQISKHKIFCFQNMSQSIFAYLIFQKLQLRPYFAKQQHPTKKYLLDK